jgi:arsenical pump membrane protein
MTHPASIATWAISAATIAAILLRPGRIAEWSWAIAGAALLVVSGLLSAPSAAAAAADGLPVYLFLAGMLTLSEIARVTGVFEWLAGVLVPMARRRPGRVFAGVYLTGIIVTALLSNDGTILLLTPAVLAVTRKAQLPRLPYLYACAFVANAASFILPISNPANLVVFRRLPAAGSWLVTFLAPSLAALVVTFAALRYAERRAIGQTFEPSFDASPITRSGTAALAAVCVSAALVVVAAAFGWPVGPAAFALGLVSLLVVAMADGRVPKRVLKETHWSIVPLVAGLFVIVQALDGTGALEYARTFFRYAGSLSHLCGNLVAGAVVTLGDNVLNNLPAGVLVRYSLHDHAIASHVANAALVGIDLGPNLSLTGSLATLLWLMTLRRDGIEVTPWQFLRVGAFVTVPSLLAALALVR